MRLLLDTHIALWLATERQRLKPAELDLLRREKAYLRVSVVSIWEVRLKWNSFYRSGDRKGPGEPHQVLLALDRLGLEVESLNAEQAAAELQFPPKHKDPFDELLLVHAQELGLQLLTRDRKLKDHPLALIA